MRDVVTKTLVKRGVDVDFPVGAGRRWVLYMPAATLRRALTVAVEPLR